REGVDIRELVDDDDDGAEDDEGDVRKLWDDHFESLSEDYSLDCKNAYDTIMKHVDVDSPSVFFIDGPGETGKTFLYKAFLATVRFRGLIALATASSGAATNNMKGERTDITSKNYLSWVFDAEIHLDANGIRNMIKEGNEISVQDKAKTMIFLHHHLDEALKTEYLTVKDPLVLWKNLKDRHDHQKNGDLTKSPL
nr:hypothetical protein [Tanacetum cinerariifolium]GEZ69972.1 hypothetical protein [Tanacetum cinerariifolium]